MINADYSFTFVFRYLQVDADWQEIWAFGELDGSPCNAVSTTTNRKSGVESRAVYITTWSAARYAEQHREVSPISAKVVCSN